MFDNKSMESLQRVKVSDRSKNWKRGDSDIPGIIDELIKENKREILGCWIKKTKRQKG